VEFSSECQSRKVASPFILKTEQGEYKIVKSEKCGICHRVPPTMHNVLLVPKYWTREYKIVIPESAEFASVSASHVKSQVLLNLKDWTKESTRLVIWVEFA
jgi:hypothetical protein